MEKPPKTACPDRDLFASVLLSEAGAEEREALIGHVIKCRACAVRFHVLKQVGREFRSREAEFLRLARPSLKELQSLKRATWPGQAWPVPIRLAAGLLIVLGLLAAVYLVFLQPLDTEVLRSGETAKFRLIEPEGRIPKPPLVFRWTPALRADTYTFELTGDDLGSIIREGGLKQSSYDLPADAQKKMAKGKFYIWTVEAYDELGLKTESDIQYFEIE